MRLRRLAVALLALLAPASAAQATDVDTSAGLAFDSNLYEATTAPVRGWVNRFSLTAAGRISQSARCRAGLVYQGGFKRYWTDDDGGTGGGEVAVNDVSLSAGARVTDALTVSGNGAAKLKSVNRVPGEEGYLRGTASATASLRLSARLRAEATGLAAREASRHDLLPGSAERAVAGGLVLARSRRLRARLGVDCRWLDYDRAAFLVDDRGGVSPSGYDRSDRLVTIRAGAQVYRGGLFDVVYAYTATASNSFGYDYHSHQVRLLHALALPGRLDVQAYLNLQFRHYDQSVSSAALGSPEADEYEQTSVVLKASRPISGPIGLSAQYSYFRNGSVAEGGFYRKHVVSLSLDASL